MKNQIPLNPSVWTVADTEENREYLKNLHRITIIDQDSEKVIARFASSDFKTVDKLADDFAKECNLLETYPKAIKICKSPYRDMEPQLCKYIPLENIATTGDTNLSLKYNFAEHPVEQKYYTFFNTDERDINNNNSAQDN